MNLKIGDFGISSFLPIGEYLILRAGSPSYVAPEFVNEEPCKLEPDIWALGCILFEIITLEKAFKGNTKFILQDNIRKGEYNKQLLKIHGNCSLSLDKLIENILTVERKKRPTISQVLGKNNNNIYIL